MKASAVAMLPTIGLLLGCAQSGPTAPPPPREPRPALLERFNDFRGTAGDGAQTAVDAVPTDLDGLFAPVGDRVEVRSGRIDGTIGPVQVHDDTQHHLGAVERFDADSSYLFLSVAAQNESGVGMFMMYIEDAFDNPLFTEGSLSGGQRQLDEDELQDLTLDELEELFSATSIMGCSGETLAQIDWDQPAVEFNLRVQEHASDPDQMTLEIEATFVDPQTQRELSAEGRIDLIRPPSAR